ncbi:MAG: hypothetical protein V4555_17085 [Acidobacteriota bacterium]
MKRFISFTLAAFIGFCMLIATDRRAYGYVDPGTGWLALQSFGSMLAASAYFLRRRILAMFSRKPAVKKTPERVVLAVAKRDDSINAA